MQSIADNSELFDWLHERAATAKKRVLASPMLSMMEDHVVHNIKDGGINGMSYELWVPFFEDLAGTREEPDSLGEPLAAFLTDLLSDLAGGGERREVSLLQANLMLIGSLGWGDHFAIEKGNSGALALRVKPKHSASLDVYVDIPVNLRELEACRFGIAD